MAGQQHRRRLEQQVRKRAVTLLRWLRSAHRLSLEEAAHRLALSATTLRRWARRWRRDRLQPRRRGRPPERSSRDLRDAVIALFRLAGPQLGLPALREVFPDVPRNELVELQRRYRHAHEQLGTEHIHALRWTTPGTVWAIDFTQPPTPVDGCFPRILAVRDLASHHQLLALPANDENAATAVGALQALFAEHGPPLVLKSDNGSAFIAENFRRVLEEEEVVHLLSPPRTPAYNGSIEAGIGSLKTRAHHESVRHDRPGHWTCDDVEAARRQGNDLGRPFGPSRPTPSAAWTDRSPVSDLLRNWFRTRCRHHLQEVERDTARSSGSRPAPSRAAATRLAVTRTLSESSLLQVRRRRITPPKPRRKRAKIT